MRLRAVAGSLLALSGLVLTSPPSHGGCASTPPSNRLVATTTWKHAGKGQAVAELAAILDKTDSKDTFVMTVRVLRKMGAEAREALPAILRNAERLGLLQGIADGTGHKGKGKGDTRVSAVTEEISEAMLEIASAAREGKQDNRLLPAPNYGPVPPTPSTDAPVRVPQPPAPPSPPVHPTFRIPARPAPGPWTAPTVPLTR